MDSLNKQKHEEAEKNQEARESMDDEAVKLMNEDEIKGFIDRLKSLEEEISEAISHQAEQDEILMGMIAEAKSVLGRFATWKDGIQYVGSGSKTLWEARMEQHDRILKIITSGGMVPERVEAYMNLMPGAQSKWKRLWETVQDSIIAFESMDSETHEDFFDTVVGRFRELEPLNEGGD